MTASAAPAQADRPRLDRRLKEKPQTEQKKPYPPPRDPTQQAQKGIHRRISCVDHLFLHIGSPFTYTDRLITRSYPLIAGQFTRDSHDDEHTRRVYWNRLFSISIRDILTRSLLMIFPTGDWTGLITSLGETISDTFSKSRLISLPGTNGAIFDLVNGNITSQMLRLFLVTSADPILAAALVSKYYHGIFYC